MKLWPRPGNFGEWRGWAQELYKILTTTEEKQVAKTVAYTKANVPPPVEDGMVIIVTDEVGGSTLAISLGTVWLRVKDGAPIA